MTAERGWIGEPQPRVEWHESHYSREGDRRREASASKYDFRTPVHLETRVQNLINWWRYGADDGGDEGSITIMADQLETALRGPG
jgi:hypothetical protein